MSTSSFVVLICCNKLGQLQLFLPLLLSSLSPSEKVLIIDNGSTDNTAKLIRSTYPQIFVIENKALVSFGKAANIACEFAFANRANAICFLSPDAVNITTNAVGVLTEKRAEIISPLIEIRTVPPVYLLGGTISRLAVPKLASSLTRPPLSFNTSPHFVLADAFLVAKKVIAKIGLFNESLTDQYAIIDYCVRAKDAGFRLAVQPKSTVTFASRDNLLIAETDSDDYLTFANNYSQKQLSLIGKLYQFGVKLGIIKVHL